MNNGENCIRANKEKMKAAQKRLVVIDPEKYFQKELKNPEHFVFRPKFGASETTQDLFLILKSSTLNKFAKTLLAEAVRIPNLRAVFVRMDTNVDNFFDKIQELNTPRIISKIFKVTSIEQIDRILVSWRDKRANSSIASAFIENDEIVIQACDLKHYRVRFSDFAGLDKLPKKHRERFQIDDFGNHLYWPGYNISIDLDVVRYRLDSTFRHTKNMDALSDYKEYLRKAIRKVMSNFGLTQAAVKANGGPAARHLYRIEHGEQELTAAMIDRLSCAHGLSSDVYIEELIAACDEIVEEEAEARSGFKKGA